MIARRIKCWTSAAVMLAACLMGATLYGEEACQEQEEPIVGSELAFRCCEQCDNLPEDEQCNCSDDRCNEHPEDSSCDHLVCR